LLLNIPDTIVHNLNDSKVAGLVYITAFAPDKGESVATLIKDPPPGAPVPPILPPQDGYLFLDRAKFPATRRYVAGCELFRQTNQVPQGLLASLNPTDFAATISSANAELWQPPLAGDSRDSTLTLEEARSSSSEDEATDMRQVCHPAGLHLRHSTCVEELTDKPKTD